MEGGRLSQCMKSSPRILSTVHLIVGLLNCEDQTVTLCGGGQVGLSKRGVGRVNSATAIVLNNDGSHANSGINGKPLLSLPRLLKTHTVQGKVSKGRPSGD